MRHSAMASDRWRSLGSEDHDVPFWRRPIGCWRNAMLLCPLPLVHCREVRIFHRENAAEGGCPGTTERGPREETRPQCPDVVLLPGLGDLEARRGVREVDVVLDSEAVSPRWQHDFEATERVVDSVRSELTGNQIVERQTADRSRPRGRGSVGMELVATLE